MKTLNPRRFVVPVFLMLCVMAGGSAQGVIANFLLQLLGLAIISWAIITTSRDTNSMTSAARWLLVLGVAGLALILVQLIPLPPAIWTAFPGRDVVADGFALLGQPLPYLPISMTPYAGISTVLVTIPAIAVLLAFLLVRQRESWAMAAALAMVGAALLLGALQVASGGGGDSRWYIYPISNSRAVGFFANSNHMGSLLVISVPFAAALCTAFASRSSRGATRGGALAMGIAALIVILIGVALNRSLAALGLIVPTLLFSLMLLPISATLRRIAFFAGTLAIVGALVILATAFASTEGAGGELTSVASRSEMWASTMDLVRQTTPVGTGLGSFETVYPLTENPAQADRAYVNHAHNDFLELVLELGMAGAVILLLFFGWWGAQVVRIWRSPLSSQYARAAAIASGVLLAASVVDYPLRTAAMSAVFAMCLGIMAQSRREQRRSDKDEARSAKHVTIG